MDLDEAFSIVMSLAEDNRLEKADMIMKGDRQDYNEQLEAFELIYQLYNLAMGRE